jgi:integrase/recombinase XerD
MERPIVMTNPSYQNQNQTQTHAQCDVLYDRKIDLTTTGLQHSYNKHLRVISKENALTICEYIDVMKTEINLSNNYRKLTIRLLTQLSKFHENKAFTSMIRDDIIAFLDSSRKPESADPLHKWVGSYNTYNMLLTRFFRWLYYPGVEQKKRKKPEVIENIPRLRRKEKSIYKPSELWTPEEDLLFLKYCPSSRIRCYHMIQRDIGCRPQEVLNLKIKDVVFKIVGEGKQYAEVTVNGKTGTRTLPLIDSIPYVKEYLSSGQHPYPTNPNAPLISGTSKSLGRSLNSESLNHLYNRYKNEIYPKLLESPSVAPEDKPKLRELLKKPWNPYLAGRHTSLTAKSRILKEATLRVFSGWTTNSDMPKRYVHLFGNSACEDILEKYGLIDKNPGISTLQSKQCPNCSEPNKPDSKFCNKCRMVLTYDAYSETLENQKEKEDRLTVIENQIKALMSALGNTKDQNQVNQMAKTLYDSKILDTRTQRK